MRPVTNSLMLVLLTIGLHSFAQKITIVEKDISLRDIFFSIQRQSGLSLLFDNNLIRQTKKVDINIRDGSVEEVLNYCLKDLPLTYVITDRVIVIKEKHKNDNGGSPVKYEINVCIVDDSAKHIAGATIFIRELKRGTQTAASGYFLFANIPPGI